MGASGENLEYAKVAKNAKAAKAAKFLLPGRHGGCAENAYVDDASENTWEQVKVRRGHLSRMRFKILAFLAFLALIRF